MARKLGANGVYLDAALTALDEGEWLRVDQFTRNAVYHARRRVERNPDYMFKPRRGVIVRLTRWQMMDETRRQCMSAQRLISDLLQRYGDEMTPKQRLISDLMNRRFELLIHMIDIVYPRRRG